MTANNNLADRILSAISEYNRQTNIMSLQSFGLDGHEFVSDSSYSTKVFGCLVAWDGADATVKYKVTRLDGTVIDHTGGSGVTLADGGMPIYGRITDLNVTAGAVCAYYLTEFK